MEQAFQLSAEPLFQYVASAPISSQYDAALPDFSQGCASQTSVPAGPTVHHAERSGSGIFPYLGGEQLPDGGNPVQRVECRR